MCTDRNGHDTDRITGKLIMLAVQKTMKVLLTMVGKHGVPATQWGHTDLVPALKEGRDSQDPHNSYRPLSVGALIGKGVERAIKGRRGRALEKAEKQSGEKSLHESSHG